jgi:hypothetical protein
MVDARVKSLIFRALMFKVGRERCLGDAQDERFSALKNTRGD